MDAILWMQRVRKPAKRGLLASMRFSSQVMAREHPHPNGLTRSNMVTAEAEAIAPQFSGTVRDIMTEQVRTVDWSTAVVDAARTMARHSLRRILIVDENQQVVGVLSQRDVLRHLISDPTDVTPGEKSDQVGALVSGRRPITVLPEVPLRNAALVLANNKIGCLPIVDSEGNLLGVLSASDLLEYLSGEQSRPGKEAFTFYNPAKDGLAKIPAYIRRANGDLVLPRSSLEKSDELPNFAQLGYDADHERIMVQFVDEPADGDGSLKVKRDKEQLVISARGFVAHFDLSGKASAFDVENCDGGRRLVLVPRSV